MSIQNNPALLVMDLQNGIAKHLGDTEKVLLPYRKAVEAARKQEIPVIFVRVAFRHLSQQESFSYRKSL